MLGIRVRKARIGKRYSQAQLATMLQVGRSAVANWECGTKNPSSARLLRIALVTEVSYEWLATGRGKPFLGEDWIPAAMGEIVDDPWEIRLLQAYRTCTSAGKRSVMKLLAEKSSIPKGSMLRAAGHSMLMNSDLHQRASGYGPTDSGHVDTPPLSSKQEELDSAVHVGGPPLGVTCPAEPYQQ